MRLSHYVALREFALVMKQLLYLDHYVVYTPTSWRQLSTGWARDDRVDITMRMHFGAACPRSLLNAVYQPRPLASCILEPHATLRK